MDLTPCRRVTGTGNWPPQTGNRMWDQKSLSDADFEVPGYCCLCKVFDFWRFIAFGDLGEPVFGPAPRGCIDIKRHKTSTFD